MATMNISLSDKQKAFIEEDVRDGGYVSTSDYMRDLVRQRQREKAEQTLRELIAEGLASGPAVPMEPDFFDKAKDRLEAKMATKVAEE
ncbi:type II toxin-antitoxin system ParD family antitoxin [Alcanivorax jadensis]|uniref:type II toxin-antitoxin system ParD family antitoxin n=1 Tax=Alcanivorax jadensis TaxID=64988 RepID=UPI002409528E|nr:type II toxin-antitoxin system ParD family antitoxin [Alcanivorax jadensis]MDF1637832.1 type II toxin-antitoxin system ParD family antitoxin [Alcanivorax jadensis]